MVVAIFVYDSGAEGYCSYLTRTKVSREEDGVRMVENDGNIVVFLSSYDCTVTGGFRPAIIVD